MSDATNGLISKAGFQQIVRNPLIRSIDCDERMYNLAKRYWVYDELIEDLAASGWVRFASGFKAGVYGHPQIPYCIKILGMGMGENPLYFCERGYYVEHERKMLAEFAKAGFKFLPKALGPQESVEFLINQCKVRPRQAGMRIFSNDLLITEFIPGLPMAVQTDRGLHYDANIDVFEPEVLREMTAALETLKGQLQRANNRGLLHNEPMPPNILFTLSDSNEIEAKLVDFDLAQNLAAASPDFVNSSVAELYRERSVPANPQSHAYLKTMDMHLLDEGLEVMKKMTAVVTTQSSGAPAPAPAAISFLSFEMKLGTAARFLSQKS